MYIVAGVIVVALVGYVMARPSAPSQLDGFAQCLTEKNLKVYAAWWCPHCAAQKKMFGNSYDKLISIECAAGLPQGRLGPVCTDKGITSVPTWEMPDGKRISGTQTLEKLSELSGCVLPVAE